MAETAVAAPAGRPSALTLTVAQLRYELTSFWRTPIAAFFTLVFPLVWLVSVLVVSGNPVVEPESGRRLAQFFTPGAIVFATANSCLSTPSIATAFDREAGILKRLRGTPLPAWAYLAGRIGAAALVSVAAVAVMLLVATAAYDVEIMGRTAVAFGATFLLTVACFTALGLALVAVVPSAQMTQALAPALVVVFSFVSDIFGQTQALPGWAQRLGSLLPLKHATQAVTATFNPFHPGSGWSPDHLAVLAVWTVVGSVVAVRYFAWEPRRRWGRRAVGGAEAPAAPTVVRISRRPAPSTAPAHRPPLVRLLGRQVRYAATVVWRDRGSLFSRFCCRF